MGLNRTNRDSTGTNTRSVFDDFRWWDEGDVLTQITPARWDYLRKTAGRLSGQRVLDLGCGGGMLAEPMAAAGARVTGIDPSAASLEAAREHASKNGLEIDYRLARAEQIPFDDESFDLVAAFDVLEHLDDLERSLGEVARVLRPGGRLIYDTMNRTLVSRVVVIWIGERLWPGGPPRGTHQWERFIKPVELISLLSKKGMINVEIRGFVPGGIDRRGRLRMVIGPYRGISYLGLAFKAG